MIKLSQRVLDWELNANYGGEELTHLGDLPMYVTPDDMQHTVIEQIDQHSRSGWKTITNSEQYKWDMTADGALLCTGFPPLEPAARASLGTETIYAYPHGFTCVIHANNTFSLARIA